MKKWYLFYSNDADTEKLQRLVGELQASINQERIKLQRPVGEIVKQPVSEIWNTTSIDFPLPFALVPWGQYIEIVSRSRSVEEALFYINQVIANGLSRTALVNCFKARLYETQGKIVNNFSEHMPEIQSKLVQEVLKENYDFGFATGHAKGRPTRNDPTDFRLIFEIEFVTQLFDNFKPCKLKIWRTFTDTTLQSVMAF